MVDVRDSSAQSGTGLVPRLLAWRPLQSWPTVLAAGVAVLLAGVVALAFTSQDLASAQTFVTSTTRADIVLANGTELPARIGAVVPRGAVLRTSQAGGARLTTEGRDVYVGADSTVRVVDGLHQTLERGLVMIDTRSGPALTLATTLGAGTVNAPVGALSRVEQNVGTLRLAVYDGSSSITAAGRQATTTVPALHQVRVPYDGLPEPGTALALTVRNGVYDAWEQRLAANLVQADTDLNSFASGLDGVDGLSVLNAAPASLRETVVVGLTRGEQALAVAVAQKARLHHDAEANLREVDRDRTDGGSWGVVAAIVEAPVSDVTSVLGSSLDNPATPTGTLAGGPLPGGPVPTRQSGGGGGQSTTPAVTPTHSPKTTHSPTPPPSQNPVDAAIKKVTGSLPPTPTAPPTPVPTPVPPSGPLATLVSSLLKPLTGG